MTSYGEWRTEIARRLGIGFLPSSETLNSMFARGTSAEATARQLAQEVAEKGRHHSGE